MSKNTKNVTKNDNETRINELLGALRVCEDATDKKAIRRMLRKLGHRGGLSIERNAQRDARIATLIEDAKRAKIDAIADATNDTNDDDTNEET